MHETAAVDVLLVTTTRVETEAIKAAVAAANGCKPSLRHGSHRTYQDLGTIAEATLTLVETEMGSGGPGGSLSTIQIAINDLRPACIIVVGIAFGVHRNKQQIGDILVSREVRQYELQRIGTNDDGEREIIPRGNRASASARLLSRFKSTASLEPDLPVRFGLLLSGDKLVDNEGFKRALLALEPEAIGGDMEASGVYTAAYEGNIEWVVVKAICDWADGHKRKNKKKNQQLAASNAAKLVVTTLKNGGFARTTTGQSTKITDITNIQTSPVTRADSPTAGDLSPSATFFLRPTRRTEDLEPEDILDIRSRQYRAFYYYREHDDELLTLIDGGHNVLVLGSSLSGKTRAVFEALRRVPQAVVLFPSPEAMQSGFPLPDTSDGKLFVFLDDIDDYCSKIIDHTLLNLVRRNAQVIATCRTGPEYESFEASVTSRFQETLRRVWVSKVPRTEIEREFDPSTLIHADWSWFDGNIGSIFLPLLKMSARYRELRKTDEPIGKLATTVLKALKTLYLSGNFENKSTYSEEKVKELTARMTFGVTTSFQEPTYRTALQRELMEKWHRAPYEQFLENWNSALERLRSDDFNLNFVELQGKMIRVEEVYLDRIVEKDYTLEGAWALVESLYPRREDRDTMGFFVKSGNFTARIKAVKSLAEALAVLREMAKENIKATRSLYDEIFAKVTRLEDAISVATKMEAQGLPPNASTFDLIMGIANSFEEISRVLDLLEKRRVSPTMSTLTIIASKDLSLPDRLRALDRAEGLGAQLLPEQAVALVRVASTFEVAVSLLKWMRRPGLVLDHRVYVRCIQKARTFSEANEFVLELVSAQISPTKYELDSLLQKSETFDQATAVFDRMVAAGLVPSDHTYGAYLQKAGTIQQANTVFERMRAAGVTPSATMFGHGFQKAQTFAEAEALFEQMIALGIRPNEHTFGHWMQKCDTSEEAEMILDRMVAANMRLKENSFSHWLQKLHGYDETSRGLDRMISSGVTPGISTFNIAIHSAATFAEANLLIERMSSLGIPPSKVVLGIWFERAPTFEIADSIVDRMLDAGFPATEIFNQLLRVSTAADALEIVLARMRAAGGTPNATTFNIQIAKAESSRDACILFGKMSAEGIVPDQTTYNRLFEKANSFAEANTVFEFVLAADVRAHTSVFNHLLRHAESLDDAYLVFDRMRSSSIEPNILSYNLLISKMDSFEAASLEIERLLDSDMVLNLETFGAWLANTRSAEQMNLVIERVRVLDRSLTVETVNALIQMAGSFEVASWLLGYMTANDCRPNTTTFHISMQTVATFEQGHFLYANMVAAGLSPSESFFSIWATNMKSFDEVFDTIAVMERQGVQPSLSSCLSLAYRAASAAQAEKAIAKVVSLGFSVDDRVHGALAGTLPHDVLLEILATNGHLRRPGLRVICRYVMRSVTPAHAAGLFRVLEGWGWTLSPRTTREQVELEIQLATSEANALAMLNLGSWSEP